MRAVSKIALGENGQEESEDVTLQELVDAIRDGHKLKYKSELDGSTWEEWAALSIEDRRLLSPGHWDSPIGAVIKEWRREAAKASAVTLADIAAEVEGKQESLGEEIFEFSYEDFRALDPDARQSIVGAAARKVRYIVSRWSGASAERDELETVMAVEGVNEDMARSIIGARKAAKVARKKGVEVSVGTGASGGDSSRFLLADAIKKGQLALLSGSSGAGKSAVVTDLACAIAADAVTWAGRNLESFDVAVVYVAAERYNDTCARVEAFRKRHGVKHLPMIILDKQNADLTQESEIDDLIEIAGTMDSYDVIYVIDTLSASFGAGDQNSPKDMGNYVKSLKKLLSHGGGASGGQANIMLVHHNGHNGERPKGASDLTGYADISMFLRNKKGLITLDVIKANSVDDSQRIATMRMEFEELVGYDEEEPFSVPVMVHVDPTEAAQQPKPEKASKPASGKAAVSKPIAKSDAHVLAEGMDRPFTKEELRAAFYGANPEAKRDTLLKRFSRQFDSLLSAGHIAGQPNTDTFILA